MRFANLLRATRLEHGTSFRSIAKASAHQWTKDQLKQIEEGLLTLDDSVVESVSMAYGADLASILPSRLAVDIAKDGVISAGGVRAVFVPHNETSLLTAYLRLIRAMRRQRKAPMIALRRDDIEVLAAHLAVPGERVVDRLTSLMGATLHQRTAIASMFAMGAVVIGLAGATVAGPPDRSAAIVAGKDPSASTVVAVVQAKNQTEVTTAVVDSTTSTEPATDVPQTVAAAPVADTTVTVSPTSTSSPATTTVNPAPVPVSTAGRSGSVAVAPPVVPPTSATTAAIVSTATTNAADPPLVPTDPVPIVATDTPPVPPTTVDPGSAEPPTVPASPTTTEAVGSPPVP